MRHSVSAISPATPRARAFTLIELMVAVTILAVLIIIFGGVLSQVQRAINMSNDAIRIDKAVAAANKLLRADISAVNKSGFLRITGGNQIAFTVVGTFESKTTPGQMANAVIIDYGRLGGSDVLWRRVHLLNPELGASGDMLAASLAESADPTIVPTTTYTADAAITLPPACVEDWADYLVGNCTEFKGFWWNGTDWSGEGASDMWTGANPDDWPKAVRARFGLEGRLFEVIVKIE